ncbi:MAG: hypothetical protein IH987_14280 [Planctomycetes bacterium]|nr:hypothetical protein [Planctomycetota bacterium]
MPLSLGGGNEIRRRETLLSNEFPNGDPGWARFPPPEDRLDYFKVDSAVNIPS